MFDDEVDHFEQSALKEVIERVFGSKPKVSRQEGSLILWFEDQSSDHKRILKKVRLTLWGTGFTLALTQGDGAAVRKVKDGNIDLFLVDIRFGSSPHLEKLGLEAIAALRRHRKDVPVVAVSAYGEPLLIEGAIGAGAVSYFLKPDGSTGSGATYGRTFEKEVFEEGLREIYGPTRLLRVPPDGFITDRTGRFWEGWKDKDSREQVHQILAEMFRDYTRIEVIRIVAEGLSASRTFFVRPIRRQRARELEYNPRLIKIGPWFEIAYEEERYRDVIDGYVDTFIGMLIPGSYVRVGDLAGIMYTSVGASRHYIGAMPEYPYTLQQYIEFYLEQDPKEAPAKICRCLKIIYDKILHGLYRNRVVREDAILPYYAFLLPALLSLKYEEDESGEGDTIDLGRYPEGSENSYIARANETLRRVLAMEHGQRVRVTNGRLEELRTFGGGCIRLTDGYWGFKIDVKDPPAEILRDPRMRRGKVVPIICGTVAGTSRDFLQNRLRSVLRELEIDFVTWDFFKDGTLKEFLKALGTFPCLKLPEPIDFVLKTFTYTYRCRMTFSTIHGDLNLGNLLIAGRGETADYWMVDFAKAQDNQPTAFDFTKLECEIRTQILSKILLRVAHRLELDGRRRDQVYRQMLADYLVWEMNLTPETDYDQVLSRYETLPGGDFLGDPRVKALFAVVCYIRGLAAATLEVAGERLEERPGLGPEEYLCAVIFYSLSALKFENLMDPRRHPAAPWPAFIAYLCCACACEKLKRLVPYKLPPG